MTQQMPKKPRPLHFHEWLNSTTKCGKRTSRCRSAADVQQFDRMSRLLDRTCPVCKAHVESIRPRAHGGA